MGSQGLERGTLKRRDRSGSKTLLQEHLIWSSRVGCGTPFPTQVQQRVAPWSLRVHCPYGCITKNIRTENGLSEGIIQMPVVCAEIRGLCLIHPGNISELRMIRDRLRRIHTFYRVRIRRNVVQICDSLFVVPSPQVRLWGVHRNF